jgi:HAD superfamily hydrolase (TIGR01509 family)
MRQRQEVRGRLDDRLPDAVLLDMDGTLVDSDAAVERAWMAWAVEFSVDPACALALAHGGSAEDTARRLVPGLSPGELSAAAARQLEFQYHDLADVVPAAGAHRLLHALTRSGVPWAVVTNADRRLAAVRLTAAGIEPPVLVTSDDVPAGKPDPAGYRLAAARLGADPAHCLVVEDSEPGLAAGRASGARTASLRGLPADVQLDDVGELADLLASRDPRLLGTEACPRTST